MDHDVKEAEEQEAGGESLPLTRREFRFGEYEGLFERAPGKPEHLVVALTGVGNTSEPLKSFEFLRSLMPREDIDRVFLRDNLRSWYRCEEGRNLLIAHLRRLIRKGRYRLVTLMGVSMGAYGALSLGEALREARVVAMSPPISLDTRRYGRGVIRHKKWLDANQHYEGTDLRPLGEPGRFLILFGDDEVLDLANLERFIERGWPGVYLCPGAAHNLAGTLAQRQRLGLFIDRLARGEPISTLAAAAGAYPAFSHCHAMQLLRARRHLYAGEMEAAGECLRDAAMAVGADRKAVAHLALVRRGLMEPLEAGGGPGWLTLTVPLEGGGELVLESAQARLSSGVPMLGPVTRGVLRLPGGAGEAELAFQPEAPVPCNAGGDLTLEAYLPEGEGYRPVLSAASPQEVFRLPLRLDEAGEARFLLRRRCFGSGYDAKASDGQHIWSLMLRKLSVTRR
ncbi:hypothetical protein IAI18_03320 [Acetobacteraceae bacterium H6797]|nr:hypothetical protein [Acetobacteraceae bacterium H6797]